MRFKYLIPLFVCLVLLLLAEVGRKNRENNSRVDVAAMIADEPCDALSAPPHCLSCHREMVLRYRRKDHEPFWGCSRFPSCRGTRQWTGITWYEYRTAMRDEHQPPSRISLAAYRELIGDSR